MLKLFLKALPVEEYSRHFETKTINTRTKAKSNLNSSLHTECGLDVFHRRPVPVRSRGGRLMWVHSTSGGPQQKAQPTPAGGNEEGGTHSSEDDETDEQREEEVESERERVFPHIIITF